jgi:hypothetical protein
VVSFLFFRSWETGQAKVNLLWMNILERVPNEIPAVCGEQDMTSVSLYTYLVPLPFTDKVRMTGRHPRLAERIPGLGYSLQQSLKQ